MIELKRHIPVALVVVAGVALSGWGFHAVRSLERARAVTEFNRAASDRIAAVQRRIDADFEVLRAITAFYGSNDRVDRQQFRSFVSAALARQTSIQALEWIPRVSAAERNAYERAAREDGYSGFQIQEPGEDNEMTPAGQRDEYFPVYFVEPYEGNKRALGFDLASNGTRRAALQIAADSGQLVASGRINLVQDARRQSAFLVFAPVYSRDAPVSTQAERRASLIGFALGVFRVGDMVISALTGSASADAGDIDLDVYDANAPNDQRLMYSHRTLAPGAQADFGVGPAAHSTTQLVRSFDVGGRRWTVIARPASPLLAESAVWQPWVTLLAGLAFTSLFAAYLLFSLNRTRAGERLVQLRTRELRDVNAELEQQIAEREATAAALHEKEVMYRNLVEGSVQGILIHRNWKPLFVNQAYADLHGYASPDEILALDSIAGLDAEHEHERLKSYHQARLAGEEVPAQYEYDALCKDGAVVTLLNSPRAVEWKGQRAVQRLLVDVTERKRAEEKFRLAVESAPNAMVMINAAGEIMMVNAQTETLFGYRREELIGQPVEMLIPERLRAQHPAERARYFESPQTRAMGLGPDLYGTRKDGSEFPVEIGLNPIETDEGTLVLSAIVDITERKKIDQMKNEFISTVSHELRTPLTSIIGSLGLIRAGAAGEFSEAAGSMIEIAYKNSDRLVRLINDILDVEKIESGKLVFRFEPLDVDEIIAEAVDANTGFAKQHQVNFVVERRLGGVRISGDKDRLMQVLTNLLSNAVKFSPPGGEVVIRLASNTSRVRVEVRDRGPGIPDDFRGEIFGKFAQADSSDTRRTGGTGLGLSIAKAIVERLDGTIGFDTQVGKGTTFFFELPEHREVVAPVQSPVTSRSGNRLLVCEDDADVAALLTEILARQGYVVDTANSARQAKQMLAAHNYSAMTLDLRLPDQSGVEFIRELREQAHTQDLPVIVVSALAAETEGELAGDAVGIIDWLDKPIDQERLVRGVKWATRVYTGARPRILHVEDEEDVLRVVAAVLGQHAQVTAARSLREARALLEREHYDLVLLDLMLPDGSGGDLLPQLNTSNRGCIPAIIFSADDISPELASKVSATLVKSRTSNESLAETIQGLIRASGLAGESVETAA
jgi:PAS domain S-box-containing protein